MASSPAAPPQTPHAQTSSFPTAPSAEIVYFIMREEGFYAHPDDVSDPYNCTVGYGTLLHQRPCDDRASEHRYRHGITQAQGISLILARLIPYANSIRSRLSVPITQQQFDALCDFAYTTGTGPRNHLLTGLIHYINSRQFAIIPTLLRRYSGAINTEGRMVHPHGLVRRREHEALLWERGDYGHGSPGVHHGCRRSIDNCSTRRH